MTGIPGSPPPDGTVRARTRTNSAGTAGAFRRLGETQAAHAAGDAMVAVALADTLFFAVPVGEARHQIALYLGLTMAPFALLSPIVGPWLDRRRGSLRLAIVVAALSRAVLAVVLSSRTDRLEVYPLAFGLLVLSRVHGVSRSALVPEVGSGDRSLVGANARLAVISVIAGGAGAGIGAGLTHLFAVDAALWGASIVFVVAAITGVQLPSPASRQPRREGLVDYRAILTSRLMAAGVAMAASRAAVGFITFLLAFLMRIEQVAAADFAVVLAAGAAGGFAGSLLAPLLRVVLRESLLLVAALGAMAAVAWWAGPRFDRTSAAVVAGVVGLASGAGRLAFDSLLQHDVPELARGRTFARYEGIFQLAWVSGAMLAVMFPAGATSGFRTLCIICVGGAVVSSWRLVRGRVRGPRAHVSELGGR